MLTINREDEVGRLAQRMLHRFRQNPPQDILEPELIVVQNHGMARWLSLYIAEERGVAANLDFVFPAELFWRLLRIRDPEIPRDLPSERSPMHWAIFDILGSASDARLSVLQRYIQQGDSGRREMRRWNLAGRIADVFDQYLTYRPRMVLQWQDPGFEPGSGTERWQAALWNAMRSRWRRQGMPHRAELQKALKQDIGNNALDTERLPSRVTVFGVTEMPPVYLEALVKLSCCTPVHFYLNDFYYRREGDLVQSLGQAGSDFNTLFTGFSEEVRKQGVEVSGPSATASPKSPPGPDSLFSALKVLLAGGEPDFRGTAADPSLQVHSCHSPRREVEVLYDQLLKLFDANPGLDPADVLVLCPRMERYAPEIDAVFGAPEPALPAIPYHLSDGRTDTHVTDRTFRQLLEVVDSRFKVTDILDILDSDPVRRTFSFSADDIHMLEHWVNENRVRWALDADHKAGLGLPPTSQFTWQSGLNRMLSGYAMQPEEDRLYKDIHPYGEVQQSDRAELLGRFARFMHLLRQCRSESREVRTPDRWQTVLSGWLNRFFPEDESHWRPVQWLREAIGEMAGHAAQGGCGEAIPFDVVRQYMNDALDGKQTGGGRPGKGVTFSAMVQMRNIPSRVIGMIGMDDGVFPRPARGSEFDLMARDPQPGDRHPSRDDRQIFLEALLSARQVAYLSYVGQSNRKNIEYPPSVVLRELLDTLEQQFGIASDEVIQKHKLHSFSPDYFRNNMGVGLVSYSVRNREIAAQLKEGGDRRRVFLAGRLPEPEPPARELTIDELTDFYRQPARYVLRRRMGIYLREENAPDEDREDFTMTGLTRYQVARQLLERYMEGQPLEDYRRVAAAQNLIPEGWPGRQALHQQERDVRKFGGFLRSVLDQEQLEPLEADLAAGPFHLTGRLEPVYPLGLVSYRFGRGRAADLVEAWIRHLVYQQVRPDTYPEKSVLYTRDKGDTVTVRSFSRPAEPGRLLRMLMDQYWEGLQAPFPFFPEMSLAYAEGIIDREWEEGRAVQRAGKEWQDPYSDYPREGDDAYNYQYMNGVNPLNDKELEKLFKEISVRFWRPVLTAMETSGGVQ